MSIATIVVTHEPERDTWIWTMRINGFEIHAHGRSANYESAWADGIAALVYHRGAKMIPRVVDSEPHLESSIGAPD